MRRFSFIVKLRIKAQLIPYSIKSKHILVIQASSDMSAKASVLLVFATLATLASLVFADSNDICKDLENNKEVQQCFSSRMDEAMNEGDPCQVTKKVSTKLDTNRSW